MKTKLLAVIGMVCLGCLVVNGSVSADGYYVSGSSGPWAINSFFEAGPYGTEMTIDIGGGTPHPHYILGSWLDYVNPGYYPDEIDYIFNITSIPGVGSYRLTVGADERDGTNGSIYLNGNLVKSYVHSDFGWVESAGKIAVDIQPIVGQNTITIDSSDTASEGLKFAYVKLDVTPPPAVTFPVNPVQAWFGDNVTITPVVTSGNPPITYLWSNGSTESSLTVYVLSGMNETFTLTATDALGNGGQGQVTVVDQSDKALQNLIDLLPPGLLNPNTSRGEAKQGEWR